MNDVFIELRSAMVSNPEYQALLAEALKYQPVVPAFVIADSTRKQEQVIDRIKFETARKDGFDLLHRLLTGK